jgi:site-specific DNA-methyltransferase (adenine-specific)
VQLFNDDCLKILPTIPDKSIDLILTDPPYGTTACSWDSIIPFDKMWSELKRIIKDNKAIVLFGAEPFSSNLRMSNIKNYKYDWIWEKDNGTNFASVKYQPFKVYENILVFGDFPVAYTPKNIKCYNPQMTNGKPYKTVSGKQKSDSAIIRDGCKEKMSNYETINNGQRYPRNIIKFNRDKNKIHPTQKPVSLIEYLIKTFSNENDTVLDFTMGSGTTGVACKNVNRNFIGIELDEKYFDIAKNRIESTNQTLFSV